MDILRFTTAGSVDDGKSTLIGRLLYDTSNIKSDVLDAVKNSHNDINLAHITDGLRAEREQGITIDVAYKYFTTKTRKYIITDAPGHSQYTKNLITGASNVDLIVILIDAVNGITEQTRRHALVASFLKIRNIVVVINKMDLVNYDEQIFNLINLDFLRITGELEMHDITFIPMSALNGENVSFNSDKMEWYKGFTLQQYLESYTPPIAEDHDLRLSIQYTSSVQKSIFGYVISGSVKKNDIVTILPGKHLARVEKLLCGFDEIDEAQAGQNVVLYLQADFFPSRGNVLVDDSQIPQCGNRISAMLCWLNVDLPLSMGKEYYLRIHSAETPCKITRIESKIEVGTFKKRYDGNSVAVNEFANVNIETSEMIVFDTSIPEFSRGIIIDPVTNYTSGAFTILQSSQ